MGHAWVTEDLPSVVQLHYGFDIVSLIATSNDGYEGFIYHTYADQKGFRGRPVPHFRLFSSYFDLYNKLTSVPKRHFYPQSELLIADI